MVLAKSSLDTDIYNTVYNALHSSTTGLADVLTPARTTGSFVFAMPADDTTSSRSFKSYPIVLVGAPETNFIPVTFSKDNSEPAVSFKVVAEDALTLKALTDKLKAYMNTYKTTWYGVGLNNLKIYDVAAGSEVRGETMCHIRMVNCVWRWIE
jgi:hypothetical protein